MAESSNKCSLHREHEASTIFVQFKTNSIKKLRKKVFNAHHFDERRLSPLESEDGLYHISAFRSGRAFIRFKEADAVVKSIKALRHKLWRMSIPPNRCE